VSSTPWQDKPAACDIVDRLSALQRTYLERRRPTWAIRDSARLRNERPPCSTHSNGTSPIAHIPPSPGCLRLPQSQEIDGPCSWEGYSTALSCPQNGPPSRCWQPTAWTIIHARRRRHSTLSFREPPRVQPGDAVTPCGRDRHHARRTSLPRTVGFQYNPTNGCRPIRDVYGVSRTGQRAVFGGAMPRDEARAGSATASMRRPR